MAPKVLVNLLLKGQIYPWWVVPPVRDPLKAIKMVN